jgi:hypothetical protein
MAQYRTHRRGDRSLRARTCRSRSAQTAFPTANRSDWILGDHQLAHHINDLLHRGHTLLELPP